MKHTFLIRNPNKSIPSLIKACKLCDFPATGDDNGIEQLYNMYKTVQLVCPSPVVIDADDLLANPRDDGALLLCHWLTIPGDHANLDSRDSVRLDRIHLL